MKEVDVLLQSGVILYPTDTIWGIGCDATNPAAIEKVINIKGKGRANKSLIVLVADMDMLEEYVEVPAAALNLMQSAKEPLTIIYPTVRNLPLHLLSNNNSLGIRIVQHSYCQQLIRTLGKPMVSTSANLSGQPSPLSFDGIDLNIKHSVDYIADIEHNKISDFACSAIFLIDDNGSTTKIR
ncbi:MAG: threonylcarbamoyl-AMP synthase [Bacteroidales bacterium]|nr:threonylcarbamoyl-AMP synthase [Bacteroidales bacterium]